MSDYVISAETRDQLIDLLEALAVGEGPLFRGPHARTAANILPHIKRAMPTTTERQATAVLAAVVLAAGGEVRVPQRIGVFGATLSVVDDPRDYTTVYRASES